MKYYYINGAAGGTFRDRDQFYSRLQDIRKRAKGSHTEWLGAYLVTTYQLKDGRAIYTEDTDYGVPYSLEIEGEEA